MMYICKTSSTLPLVERYNHLQIIFSLAHKNFAPNLETPSKRLKTKLINYLCKGLLLGCCTTLGAVFLVCECSSVSTLFADNVVHTMCVILVEGCELRIQVNPIK